MTNKIVILCLYKERQSKEPGKGNAPSNNTKAFPTP